MTREDDEMKKYLNAKAQAQQDEFARRRKVIAEVIVFGILGIILLTALFSTFYTIPAGYRGVLLTFGKPSMSAQGEGLHIKIPFVQEVVKMEVRTQKYQADLTAASQDLQDVATTIAVNYRINPEQAPYIYQTLGAGYSDIVIYPIEQETNKAVTAEFTAEELITKRDIVRNEMQNQLIERLKQYNIIVEQVSIVNFQFSESFSSAIEQKVTAEQNALKEQNNLKVIEFQAQQQVAAARGTAESIQIINQELAKSPDYLQWQAIQKWNGQLPNVIGGANPFFNIESFATK